MTARFAQVIVDVRPAHLDRPYDYAVPEGADVAVGHQVRVLFAGRRRHGWVVGLTDEPDTDPARIRELTGVDGRYTWFDPSDLDWLRWCARRYAATLSDVLRHALPPRVADVEAEAAAWSDPPAFRGAERPPCPASSWRPYDPAHELLQAAAAPPAAGPGPAFWLRPLPGDDETALLCDLVNRTLAAGRTALIIAPDPAHPLPAAAAALAGPHSADLRLDAPGAGEDPRAASPQRRRYRAFLRARLGHGRVIVGERAAACTPVRDLGLIVLADEASPAYKERRSPRYHAREVALARAWMAGAVCVLTGDLPSANAWRAMEHGHVTTVAGHRAVERERAPRVDAVDPAATAGVRARLAAPLAEALSAAVGAGEATVVLAARGGQGTALACRACRRRLPCPVCDGALGDDRRGGAAQEAAPRWRCATCEWVGEPFPCPDCGAGDAVPLAAGTRRLASELARSHPDAEVVAMEGFDAAGPTRRPAIAVMTRGSVVARPGWLAEDEHPLLLVADADAMLGRPHLAAAEDALRLWFAAGRWSRRVLVQTREPEHPAVQALVRWDPAGFWHGETERRRPLGYPPLASLVTVKAPAAIAGTVAEGLREAMPPSAEVLGPDLDGATLIKTTDLHATLVALAPLRARWGRDNARVRVDVDPL